jgi:hypothetical protein
MRFTLKMLPQQSHTVPNIRAQTNMQTKPSLYCFCFSNKLIYSLVAASSLLHPCGEGRRAKVLFICFREISKLLIGVLALLDLGSSLPHPTTEVVSVVGAPSLMPLQLPLGY